MKREIFKNTAASQRKPVPMHDGRALKSEHSKHKPNEGAALVKWDLGAGLPAKLG